MGFGVLWVAQLHLSAPVLIPFAAYVFVSTFTANRREALRGLLWFAIGALVAGSTLVPTLLRYGWAESTSAAANYQVNARNLGNIPKLAARFLSLASFELSRFIGNNTSARLQFLAEYPWVVPFALFAGIAGLMQPVILVIGFFRRQGSADWRLIRNLTAGMLGLLAVSFAFSAKDPASHTFYLTLPLVMVFSFYCWRPFLRHRRWRVVAVGLLICGSVTHLAIAVNNFKDVSLYPVRPLVARAIEEKNFYLLAQWRPAVWERVRKRPGWDKPSGSEGGVPAGPGRATRMATERQPAGDSR
jgi:hypothetical protein